MFKLTRMTMKQARVTKGHTQQQAATEIGVTPNTWARWERGVMCPSMMARKAIERYIEGATDEA